MNDALISAIPSWSDRNVQAAIATNGTPSVHGRVPWTQAAVRGGPMEKDLAQHVIPTAFRAGRELEELLPLLKRSLDAEQ